MTASGAKLARQVHEIGGDDLTGRIRGEIRHVMWTMLQRARDKSSLHPLCLGGAEILLVGGNHHHLITLQPEQVDRHLVGARIGLVGLDSLCGENAVPRQRTILGHVHEQGHIPVREGRQDQALAQVRESWDGIRPGLKPVPHASEVDCLVFGQAV
jgi:hypothetical protein